MSKKNDDKSAVALLKKDDWHERGTRFRPMSRSIRENLIRGVIKKFGTKSHLKRRLSDARQLGLCISRHDAAEGLFSGSAQTCRKTIQRVKFTKGCLRVTLKIRDQKSFARIYFAQVNLISAAPTLQHLRIGPQEETEWQEQGAREAAWKLAKKYVKIKGA